MPKGNGLSESIKEGIWELRAEGLSDREIGRRLGLARGSVSNHLARTGGIRPRARRRALGRMPPVRRRWLLTLPRGRPSRRPISRSLSPSARSSQIPSFIDSLRP